jgi:hypothetical protein
VPFFSQNRERDGRTPTLVLCSRNARPQKGLVRRPHFDQHGCPSKREKQASLERAGEGRLDGLLWSCNARSRKILVGHAQWETILARPQGKRSKSDGRSMRAVESNLGRSLSSPQLKSPACGQIFPGRAPSFLFTLLEYSASSDSGQPLLFDCHTTACCTNCGYDFWSYHRNIRCRPGFRIS